MHAPRIRVPLEQDAGREETDAWSCVPQIFLNGKGLNPHSKVLISQTQENRQRIKATPLHPRRIGRQPVD